MIFSNNHEKVQSSTKWIYELKAKNVQLHTVGHVLPKNYDCYFKLFFPVLIENQQGEMKHINYKALAELAKTEYNLSLSWMSLPRQLKAKILRNSTNDIKFITSLMEILGEESDCIFHGFGGDGVSEKFEKAWIQEAPVSKLLNIVQEMNENDQMDTFPNYIFAKDRSWCIGRIINSSEIILLGCNIDLANKIRNRNEIDYQEISLNCSC